MSVADESVGGLTSAGGGVGRTGDVAYGAAIGESIERYAAALATLDVTPQPAHDEVLSWRDWATLHDGSPAPFRYQDGPWATVWSLGDNRPASAPAALVGLGGFPHQPATSSGLAANPQVATALLRAAQELVERDALMGMFLHGLPGRAIGTIEGFTAFDLTQDWSPHLVVAVAGGRPLAGRLRWSLGAACRASRDDAIERAYLECEQGVVFVGTMLGYRPDLGAVRPDEVTTFDHHAVYYSTRPDQLAVLPLLQQPSTPTVAGTATAPHGTTASEEPRDPADELEELIGSLAAAGIEMWYRELTTPDVASIGMRVVRVLSEQLTPIHHDHRHRATGGTTPHRRWRWSNLEPLVQFPSPFPHPLG